MKDLFPGAEVDREISDREQRLVPARQIRLRRGRRSAKTGRAIVTRVAPFFDRHGVHRPRLCRVSGGNREHQRLLQPVDLHGLRVAGVKGVALNVVVEIRRRAGNGEQCLPLDAELRQCAEQGAGVGVDGAGKDFLCRPRFDDLAGVHNGHAVGDICHHAEIVRDEDHAQPHAALNIAQQPEDLRLQRHVERGGGLIADEHLGVGGDRGRDDDALAHAAGKLVRVFPVAVRGDADLFHQLFRLFRGGVFAEVGVQRDHLADLFADGFERVERRHRVLKHHGDALAADGEPVFFRKAVEPGALEVDAAADDRTVFVGHADERLGQHALAAAGFTDDGERFVFIEIEARAAHGGERFAAQTEVHAEVADAENRICHSCVPP